MTVTGGKELIAALNRLPRIAEQAVADALLKGAGLVLQDMRTYTPRDASNPGPHVADGLTIVTSPDGLEARVGLPTQALASDYFWFRFLDSGTKGGEISYWRRSANGSRTRQTMRVPSRPALRIRERALDGNIEEVRRLVVQAIEQGIAQAV